MGAKATAVARVDRLRVTAWLYLSERVTGIEPA